MLRNADVFVKPRHDLRTKSATGGLITVIAGSVAGLLFFAQLYTQVIGTTQHSLFLSESKLIPMLGSFDPFKARLYDIKAKMSMKLHITFPHIECSMMDIKLNGAPLKDTDYDFKSYKGGKRVAKSRPNAAQLKEAGFGEKHKGGCTIKVTLRVPVVAGHVSVTLSPVAWQKALNQLMMQAQFGELELAKSSNNNQLNQYNMTHFIHEVQFGKRFPLANDDPLERRAHIIENKMGGVALENIQIKLVPTIYSGLFTSKKTYQHSVVSHTVQPDHMMNSGLSMMPGLTMSYDVTPLAVRHESGRENIFVFLSSLMSIVGGAYVTVGLFTGCLVHSAAAVAKKVD